MAMGFLAAALGGITIRRTVRKGLGFLQGLATNEIVLQIWDATIHLATALDITLHHRSPNVAATKIPLLPKFAFIAYGSKCKVAEAISVAHQAGVATILLLIPHSLCTFFGAFLISSFGSFVEEALLTLIIP